MTGVQDSIYNGCIDKDFQQFDLTGGLKQCKILILKRLTGTFGELKPSL